MASEDTDAATCCVRCAKPSASHCAQCGVQYCGRACQRADWPTHRSHCAPKRDVVCIAEGRDGRLAIATGGAIEAVEAARAAADEEESALDADVPGATSLHEKRAAAGSAFLTDLRLAPEAWMRLHGNDGTHSYCGRGDTWMCLDLDAVDVDGRVEIVDGMCCRVRVGVGRALFLP